MSIQTNIKSKISRELKPELLSVENESGMHNVPPGSESHFKVVVVAEIFSGQRSVQRHQLIYRVLADELAGGVHALALHTYTPEEWQDRQQAPDSPECLGGKR